MEKVLQILLVTALLMLVIWRSIRGKEERFRRWSYLTRLRAPLLENIHARLLTGTFGQGDERTGWQGNERAGWQGDERTDYGVPDDVDAFLVDEERRILLCYRVDGKLTIYRLGTRGRIQEFQEMSVPMDCSGLAWDPDERKIYLEEDGFWYVYGPED